MNEHLTVNTTTDQWEGTITCAKQNNTITLSTASQYVGKNIQLDIKVVKAVLTTSSGENEFYISVPNGTNGNVVFHFTVDANGNTTVTEEDYTAT